MERIRQEGSKQRKMRVYANGEFDLYLYRKRPHLTYSQAKIKNTKSQLSKLEMKRLTEAINDGIECGFIESSERYFIIAESLGLTIEEYIEKRSKIRKSNLNRAKNNIIELIRNNFSVGDSFVTLTFKDQQGYDWTDWDTCVYELKKYFERLKYKYGKDLKYICIPELQKENGRNAWHYHILINLKYGSFDFREFNPIWGHGYVTVKEITSTGGLGWYLSAYLTECLEDIPQNKKTYFASRNLTRPIIIEDQGQIEEILADTQLSVAYNNSVETDYVSCEYVEFR